MSRRKVVTQQLTTICRPNVLQSVRSRTRKEAFTMRTTSAITRRFVLPLVLFGLLAAAPLAHAVITDHSGTICKNYFAVDVASIDYLSYGTRYLGGGSTWVICPLTRNTSGSNGAYIYVDIRHFGTQSTICLALSHDYTGTLLASAIAGWSGSGFHEFA